MKPEAALSFDKEDSFPFRKAERYGDDIHLESYNAWAGSTESGFGEHQPITLNKEEALSLAAWIVEQFK